MEDLDFDVLHDYCLILKLQQGAVQYGKMTIDESRKLFPNNTETLDFLSDCIKIVKKRNKGTSDVDVMVTALKLKDIIKN